MQIFEQTCKNCGVVFNYTSRRGTNVKFCCKACFIEYRTKNGFDHYELKPKKCRYCGDMFIPRSGPTVYCYKTECRSKGLRGQRISGNIIHQNDRRKLQKMWGYTNQRYKGSHGGEDAEAVAPNFLSVLGFTNINVICKDYPNFPFDIIANRNDKTYVIQVTMRTHTRNKYRKVTDLLNIQFGVLYVKPDLSTSIFKIPTGITSELSLKEVMPNESSDN